MRTRMKLAASIISFMAVLFVQDKANAFCVFTSGGVKLVCTTCSCSRLVADGVPVGNCVDVLRTARPTGYDKIIRYSASVVTLHSRSGKEERLASDATQSQFDAILSQRNATERLRQFKSQPGVISASRVNRLASELNLKVVSSNR